MAHLTSQTLSSPLILSTCKLSVLISSFYILEMIAASFHTSKVFLADTTATEETDTFLILGGHLHTSLASYHLAFDVLMSCIPN